MKVVAVQSSEMRQKWARYGLESREDDPGDPKGWVLYAAVPLADGSIDAATA
jgi:hypothetical protein